VILYHGSNVAIDGIDLDKCRPYKDFGKGFYTTKIKEQALDMSRRVSRIYGGQPYVTVFSINDEILFNTDLRIRRFDAPDKAWAIFIINNRNIKFLDASNIECNTDNKYDIVMGPVANDNIRLTLSLFTDGRISVRELREQLRNKKLTSQISFHTQKSIQYLIKKDVLHDN
jgi:hypothetical protein